jgi:hypothetical protein
MFYGGESIDFSCKLYDGETQVTSLSSYKFSCILKDRKTKKIAWSTTASSGVLQVTVSGGDISFSITPEVSRTLSGTFILEVKLTHQTTGKVIIGVCDEPISIAPSVIGQDNNL